MKTMKTARQLATILGFCATALVPGCLTTPTQGPPVSWHRFPVSLETRAEPDVALIYSSDNLGPTATLSRLGYPDRMIFQLHRDHPKLKVVLTSCPANRYSGERKLSDMPEASASWKALALDPNFAWIELAGLGYTFSPPGDENLNHHEFSVKQSGCNLDHSKLGEAGYTRERMTLAREAYRKAGIPDEKVIAFRFPGMEHSPRALAAAREAGFLAVLDAGHDDEPGSEWWTPLPGGGEILEIRNTNVLKLFARSQELEDSLEKGTLAPSDVTSSPAFTAALARGVGFVRKLESSGGLIHLMDSWAETFREIRGVRPRYLLVDALLRDIEARHGPRVWYPGVRDLALWLEARRRSKLTSAVKEGGIVVSVEPPEEWARVAPSGLEDASIRVGLPASPAGRLDEVQIRSGEGKWERLDASRWWRQGREAVVVFPLRGPVKLRLKVSRG